MPFSTPIALPQNLIDFVPLSDLDFTLLFYLSAPLSFDPVHTADRLRFLNKNIILFAVVVNNNFFAHFFKVFFQLVDVFFRIFDKINQAKL